MNNFVDSTQSRRHSSRLELRCDLKFSNSKLIFLMVPTKSSESIPSSKELCQYFFLPPDGNNWQCKKCSKVKLKNVGWKNLLNHLKSCFGGDFKTEYRFIQKSTGGIISGYFLKMSNAKKEMFDWIELLVMKNLPLTFFDFPFVRSQSKLRSVCSKTVHKHIFALVEVVRETYTSSLIWSITTATCGFAEVSF
jgi:hypothetical protein